MPVLYQLCCDYCGNIHQIYTDENKTHNEGFEFCFFTLDAFSSLETANKRYNPKYNSLTFCDKDCLIEYLKTNLNKDGTLKQQDKK